MCEARRVLNVREWKNLFAFIFAAWPSRRIQYNAFDTVLHCRLFVRRSHWRAV